MVTNMERKDEELRRLRQRLDMERRANARLKRELTDLRRDIQARQSEEKPLTRFRRRAGKARREERLLGEATRRARHFRKPSFLRYLWESVMDSAPVAFIVGLWRYMRRVRVAQTVLSLAVAVGAVTAVAVLAAALLPFLLAGAGALTLWVALGSRRMNRRIKKELAGRRVRVLVPPRGRALEEGSFFVRSARDMAAAAGVTVLVVTPYVFSRRGLGGGGRFFTARKETEGLYLVRRHYFFILRRQVLDALEGEVTVVY